MSSGEENAPLVTKDGSRKYVYVLTCFATIGGLLFGYDTGIVSGSMLLIRDDFQLSTIWQEIIVSATIGAAALFSLVAGSLVDRFGRKKVIMSASVIFTIGAVVMAMSPTDKKEILLAGRLIVGAGIGFASMSVPIYVAEAAPADIRGALVTVFQLFITIGILVSSLIAGAFSSDKVNGWRYMLGLAGVPGVIQFIGFLFLPETPRWLVKMKKHDQARECLIKIRGTSNIDKELNDIQQAVREEEMQQRHSGLKIFVMMLTSQPVRKALILGCLLMVFQQLCGINTVIYYSASILRMSGFPSELAIWLACIPNAVNMVCTFIGVYTVEKLGRRSLTLISFLGIIIALVILGTGFYLADHNSPPISNMSHFGGNSNCYDYRWCSDCTLDDHCGFCWENKNEDTTGACLPVYSEHPERYAVPPVNSSDTYRCNQTDYEGPKTYRWANDYCPTSYGWMSVLGLALFVFSFAPGLGPNPWTINSEIYPLWARGTAISIATAVNWLANLLVSLTFLTLLETITRYGTFYLFAGISSVGFVVIFCILPETKNKTLEEVTDIFMTEQFRRLHTQIPEGTTSIKGDNNAYQQSST
ncbi:hypothetical protein FSP39_010349 [Pinctada imbricata]|uniref:Major facilitator superfamily (MFS) profile domain-containing protein n=1 Tax=Pinctada imbricata TaxID=66713 RepID=A0AA89CAE0_PINIB|nr:hypothetical protein FSP39_010349 [Pinctada imbricata]